MAKLEGVEVKLGRSTFVVPPITVWAQEQLETFSGASDPKGNMDGLLAQMLMLLEPNYPGLTVADLKKTIPLRDLSACLASVAKAAGDGLEMAAPGEEARP